VNSRRPRLIALGAAVSLAIALWAPEARASTSVVTAATIGVRPTSGPGGTLVGVRGSGYLSGRCAWVSIVFIDATGTSTSMAGTFVGPDGTFQTTVTIPLGASVGQGMISGSQRVYSPYLRRCSPPGRSASAIFTVGTAYEVPDAQIQVRPVIGPAGTRIEILGNGFSGCNAVSINFTDAASTTTHLGDAVGPTFRTTGAIPEDAAVGAGTVKASQWRLLYFNHHLYCRPPGPSGSTAFTVTQVEARAS